MVFFLSESILASKKDPTNVDILMTKASIYENLKLPKKQMEVYENILKVIITVYICVILVWDTITSFSRQYCCQYE